MTNTQITLIQLDNYGPWTTTPKPRREPDLQVLQASIYADLNQMFGAKDGYVFFTRYDNMIAITNGSLRNDHQRIQDSIGNQYPVSVSFAVGVNSIPIRAIAEASELLQDAGSAQDEDRSEVFVGRCLPSDDQRYDDVQIAHFDVINATGQLTDCLNGYDSLLHINRAFGELAYYMRNNLNSMVFFVGGDNFIAPCGNLSERDYRDAISYVRDMTGIELQVGVGLGESANEAGYAAKEALENCRANETAYERDVAVSNAD